MEPQVVRYSERPELWDAISGLSDEIWPEYNQHGSTLNHIAGTVAEWESWTGLRFPETGDYAFPAGLATVHIHREQDTGEYWEPNIWIIHETGGGPPG